jgi:pimeloyl-ACP methyl ester carboxylesterase
MSDRSALARGRGDFCSGGRGALLNKSNIDTHTIDSLGAFDLRPGLAVVTAPTLIVQPVADVFADSAPQWAAALPNSRLATLQQAGHFPWLETPDAFFALIDDFMREQ